MSKKDYILFARLLRESSSLADFRIRLAQHFTEENPSFNQEKFLEASASSSPKYHMVAVPDGIQIFIALSDVKDLEEILSQSYNLPSGALSLRDALAIDLQLCGREHD